MQLVTYKSKLQAYQKKVALDSKHKNKDETIARLKSFFTKLSVIDIRNIKIM